MIKNHLKDLIDIRLIVVFIIIIAVTVILTMIFSDKVKEFALKYKKKFYIYIFSFMFVYALIAFLGFNKLFTDLSDEFLFYQIASLLFGSFHVYFYRFYFSKFNIDAIGYELLFALIVVLFSSIPFILIYTALSGISLTFLMCSHFIAFFVPTGVNCLFNTIMIIPPKIYLTWKIPEDEKAFPVLEDSEMRDLVVVTLLIKKNEDDLVYSSFRSKGPIRLDFGRLFYYCISNYNERYKENQVALSLEDESCNWVFFLQPKWYQRSRYVDANYTLYMNGITENSVIICQRERKQVDAPQKNEENLYDYEHNVPEKQ